MRISFTVAKDLAKLTTEKIRRRHSITLCESRHRKSSTESTTSSIESSTTSPRASPSKERENSNQFTSLNVASMQEKADTNQDFTTNNKVKTLNLGLEEVAHIRSVLTKAELGMFSQKISIITIFGHKYIRQTFNIFYENI